MKETKQETNEVAKVDQEPEKIDLVKVVDEASEEENREEDADGDVDIEMNVKTPLQKNDQREAKISDDEEEVEPASGEKKVVSETNSDDLVKQSKSAAQLEISRVDTASPERFTEEKGDKATEDDEQQPRRGSLNIDIVKN